MKSQLIIPVILLSILVSSKKLYAQYENVPQFEIGLSGNYLINGYTKWGTGISSKYLMPTRRNNFFTAGIIYDLQIIPDPGYKTDYYHFLNGAFGYRKMINSFFIEPQLGLGIYWDSGDQPGFGSFAGFEAGVHLNKFTFSLFPRLMIEDGFFMADGFLSLGLKCGIRLGKRQQF
jgi:hypothetical protein